MRLNRTESPTLFLIDITGLLPVRNGQRPMCAINFPEHIQTVSVLHKQNKNQNEA